MMDAEIIRRERSEDYNKFMQDMTDMILNVSVRLRGLKRKYDYDNGKYVEVKVGEPLLNEEGINFVEAKLHSYLNPNLYMAQLKTDEATNNYRIEVASFGCTLHENKEKFQILSSGLTTIIGLVSPVFYHALMKSCSDKGFVERTTKTGYNASSSDGQGGQQNIG